MSYRELDAKHTISLVTDIQASCIFYFTCLLSKYFSFMEHLLLQKQLLFTQLSEKAISGFLNQATTKHLRKVLRWSSIKQLFSIYRRSGRDKRNITLANMVCLVLLTRGRSNNTQVNSHRGQQRQRSGATSCFYRPANNFLAMSSCL